MKSVSDTLHTARPALGLACAAALLAGCRSQPLRLDPNGPDPWRARIGLAYGIETWPRVDTLQFTRREWRPTSEGPILVGERTWIHAPRERWTWLVLPGDLLGEPFLAWPLDRLPGEPEPQLDDPWSELRELFLEDAAWLFLPYTLVLDPDLCLIDQGIVGAPPDGVVARRIDVRRAADLQAAPALESAVDAPPDGAGSLAAGLAADSDSAADSASAAGSDTPPPRLRLYLADSHWIMTTQWGLAPAPAPSAAEASAAVPPSPEGSIVHSEPYPAGGLAFPLTHVRPDGSWIEYTGIYVRLSP